MYEDEEDEEPTTVKIYTPEDRPTLVPDYEPPAEASHPLGPREQYAAIARMVMARRLAP